MRDNCADSSPELGGSVEFDWDAFDRKGSVPTIDVLEKCHLRIACKTYILSPSGNKLEECGCWHFLIVSGRKYVCLCSARSFYFRRICKMSFTQNRRGDFQGIKTRELILQDPSGSFPPLNSILIVGDEKGGITTTQSLTIPQAAIELQELTTAADATGRYIRLNNGGLDFLNKAGNVANPGEFSINKDPIDGNFNLQTLTNGKKNINIDSAGNMIMSGFSTQFAASDPTASDITVNGNIYVGNSNSEQRGGAVSMRTMVLQDRATEASTYMWAGNNSLLWQSSVDPPVNLLGWSSLLDPIDTLDTIAPNDLDNITVVANKVNELINLISGRNILIKSIPIIRYIQFQTNPEMRIGGQTFTISEGLPYTYSISGLIEYLNTIFFPVSFNTRFNQVFLNITSPITISDGPRKGSAQRLMNHLGLNTIVVPLTGSLTLYRSEYGSVIDPSGLGQLPVLANPFLDPSAMSGSRYAVISWINNVDDPYGHLKFFGIYKNGSSVDIVPKERTQYTIYGLSPDTTYIYSVTSIGLYDEGALDISYQFITLSDLDVPPPTGIRLTQYVPNTTIPNVIPFESNTYGNATGVILDSSGIADPSSHVIPTDSLVVQSYLYSSSFTLTFPDDYSNVYIGFYAPDGGTVDAYRLRISDGSTVLSNKGIWGQQPVFNYGVAQYFRVNDFSGGKQYTAELVAMNAYTQSYPYSLGIFIVQVQPDFDTSLVDSYRYFSPTLDQYPKTPLLAFCS